MHNSNSFANVGTGETQESHLNVTGVQFFRLPIWTEISHGFNLQLSTTNQIRLHEMVV